jgi:hypothetical protein
MLRTVFGNIIVTINGVVMDYAAIKLPNEGKIFRVDGRFKIIVNEINACEEENIVECKIDGKHELPIKSFSESGENLTLISFEYNNTKLSIGTLGDIPGIDQEYMEDGIRIRSKKNAPINKCEFFVAWIEMHDKEKEEIYTWFAADPVYLRSFESPNQGDHNDN